MKNQKKVINSYKKATHLKWFAIVFFILILLLIIRLFYLQFIDGGTLKERAYKQITANRVLSPQRGTIYDSTGKALAVSTKVDTISINPSLIIVKGKQEETNALKEKVAKALSDIFELDYNEVLVKVTSTNSVETIAKKVGTLILAGPTSAKIEEATLNALKEQNEPMYKIEIIHSSGMEESVQIANKKARSGDIVLLSPASASFDAFKNFVERGLKFKELVNKL